MRVTGWGAGLLALALAGCSGSGEDTAYEALADEFDEIGTESFDEPYTDASLLPTAGSAEYDGVMAVAVYGSVEDEVPAFEALGEAEILVSFASADPISGGASNFRTPDNGAVGGGLVFSNSSIDRTADPFLDYSVFFDIDGTLSSGGVAYVLGGEAFGDFLGDIPVGGTPEYMFIRGDGTATYGGQSGVFGSIILADR